MGLSWEWVQEAGEWFSLQPAYNILAGVQLGEHPAAMFAEHMKLTTLEETWDLIHDGGGHISSGGNGIYYVFIIV